MTLAQRSFYPIFRHVLSLDAVLYRHADRESTNFPQDIAEHSSASWTELAQTRDDNQHAHRILTRVKLQEEKKCTDGRISGESRLRARKDIKKENRGRK